MTDEIIKLYENAGIEPIAEYCKHQCNNEFDDNACIGCKHIEKVEYPPFTAEKQIELIKWLAKRLDFGLEYYQDKTWAVQTQFSWEFYCKTYNHKEFEQALAGLINTLWQDLSLEEKQQVKGILE